MKKTLTKFKQEVRRFYASKKTGLFIRDIHFDYDEQLNPYVKFDWTKPYTCTITYHNELIKMAKYELKVYDKKNNLFLIHRMPTVNQALELFHHINLLGKEQQK